MLVVEGGFGRYGRRCRLGGGREEEEEEEEEEEDDDDKEEAEEVFEFVVREPSFPLHRPAAVATLALLPALAALASRGALLLDLAFPCVEVCASTAATGERTRNLSCTLAPSKETPSAMSIARFRCTLGAASPQDPENPPSDLSEATTRCQGITPQLKGLLRIAPPTARAHVPSAPASPPYVVTEPAGTDVERRV